MEINAKYTSRGRINLFWFKHKTTEPAENGNDKVLNYMMQI